MEPSLRDPLQGGAECFGLLNHTLDMRDQQQSNREPLSTDGSDTQSHLQLPTSAKPAKRMQDGPWEVVVQMAVFFILAIALMGGHLGFFIWLDGQAVELSGISQSAQSAVANFFAVAVELVILGGIGVAYNQFLWRLFRLKSLKAKTIDTLVTLVMSPWDLWRPDLYNDATFAALIGILCALVPIAVVFPPGALSVEYQEGVIPVTLTNVPTMNISDFGRGGMKDVHERSFLQLEGSMVWLTSEASTLFNPRLISMASGVLASGSPLFFPSPCNKACNYNMSIAGPRFNCKELGPKEGLIDPKACQSNRLTHNEVVYRAENRIREDTRNDPMINSFKLSWYPEPFKLKCDPQELKTLDCSMTLAQYKLQIDSSSQSRSINVIIEDDKDVWPEKGIPTSFPEAFSANESPRDPEVLAAKFPLAQAYAISRAAILALAGDANLTAEAGKQDDTYAQKYYSGSATGVFGSPYIGLNNTNEPNIIITADRIQRFLQDLVISTISFSDPSEPLWVNQGDIEAMVGSEIYMFNEKMQFFAPYAACLVVTAAIYILGLWSLYKNGVSASNSFLQFVTTTSTSDTLHQVAETCSFGGAENMSQDLKDLRLRFAARGRTESDEEAGGEDSQLLVAGFVTENKVEYR